jgi:hypothetical protein
MSLSCEELKAHLAEVLVEWHELTGEQPWLSMPSDVRIDHLPDLIRELSDAALRTPADLTARLNALSAAVAHGEGRRLHGFSDGLLFTEYYLLRQAMWRYIRENWPPEEAGPAIMRIDTAITLASRAALYGYHAHELRELGHSMSDLLTDLLQQWPIERGDEQQHSEVG